MLRRGPGVKNVSELRRLRWITILAPLAFVVAVESALHGFSGYPPNWLGYAVGAAALILGALAFASVLFRLIERMQARLEQQNQELLALHQAGLALAAELEVSAVLQTIVDQAKTLAGARYGALSIIEPGGSQIQHFLTSGLSAEQRSKIGAPPVGRGLLGVVLHEGQRLRVGDMSKDPRSVGFPPHHPPMKSLLAVPIFVRGSVTGNLYLSEKSGSADFSDEDEETLVRFATQASLAIENARLHREVQAIAITEERERIAREMHDSLAQVLGYVNIKAQAAQELLSAGQPERASAQIAQLSDAARSAYDDVRESILGLRSSLTPGKSLLDVLGSFLEAWQEQSGIHVALHTEVSSDDLRTIQPIAEAQLLRIIQEGLANVRKHARASHATLHLECDATWIIATIADDGEGFDSGKIGSGGAPRFGLATMRERAEAVGGQLTVDTAPGRGTRVTARLPKSTNTIDL